MNTRNRKIAWIFLGALFFALVDVVHSQPKVYGKIMLNTSSGNLPLKDAVVELRKKDGKDVVAKTYTDDKGNFALFDVEQGAYDIAISINKKQLKQKMNDEVVEKRTIEITKNPLRIGEIVVLSE